MADQSKLPLHDAVTGVKDLHDDQVDALVAAVDATLATGTGFDLPRRTGGGRWG